MAITDKDLAGFGLAARKQIAAQLGKDAVKQAARKYHNRPTERVMPNGKTRAFDSQKEARRYDELAAMLRMGVIRNLKLQPEFTITEGFITSEGNRVRAHRYTADFSYEHLERNSYVKDGGGSLEYIDEWVTIVEDVKGGKATKTRDFINNKKALADRGIIIREV